MKTVTEMARDADPKANLSEPYCLDHETRAWLETFAALVAKKYIEKIKDLEDFITELQERT